MNVKTCFERNSPIHIENRQSEYFVLSIARSSSTPVKHASFPHAHAAFLRGVAGIRDQENRQLFATLIRHPKFNNTDWQTMDNFVKIVNKWAPQPVISEEDRRQAWHPLGMGHFHWSKKEAWKNYPKETNDLMVTLDRWRAELRKSIPQWVK